MMLTVYIYLLISVAGIGNTTTILGQYDKSETCELAKNAIPKMNAVGFYCVKAQVIITLPKIDPVAPKPL